MCELLLKNGRPEIIRLLVGLLYQPEAPPAVLRIVSRRSDVNFVKQFLEWVKSASLSEASRNLTHIRQLPWLESLGRFCPQLDSSQQLALIQLIQICGLRRCQILEVFKHILKWGEPAARKAAVQSLEAFSGPHANMLITLALNDPIRKFKRRRFGSFGARDCRRRSSVSIAFWTAPSRYSGRQHRRACRNFVLNAIWRPSTCWSLTSAKAPRHWFAK